MKDYIDSIQDEDRCVGGEYKRRLCVCRECGELFDGMCRLCSCFVEVRAIKKNGSCPHVPSKW
ncbi:MAG: DUF6171 family protein, partial [Firmicutes bacterium]|nr:DUF6171 family protein [Bacillota bacterium]